MENLRTLTIQIIGFILVSAIVGMTAQSVLPNGISIQTDLTLIETDSGMVSIPSVSINPTGAENGSASISLSNALAAYNDGDAIFMDARTLEDFEAGHIQGAVHLPVESFMDSLNYLDQLALDTFIITYCDGADCNASIDLAADLNLMGFTRVFFFFGGWQEWLEAGYPIGESSRE